MTRLSYVFSMVLCVVLFSCSDSEKAPNVSSVNINLLTHRFEQDFFNKDEPMSLDKLNALQKKYPGFLPRFIDDILGLHGAPIDTVLKYAALFAKDYQPIKDSADKLFKNFSVYEKEIGKCLQYVRYYFPKYPLPNKIITYIGPLDGFGDFIDPNDSSLGIGLQIHLGKDFSAYKTTFVQETYASYLSSRFEPGYISIYCTKNILNDMFPLLESDKPLIQQMVENGKRLYLLSKILPSTEEYKLIGYSEVQLKDCYKREPYIWDMFVKNGYLQITDKNIIKNYLGESPKTQELGEGSPGNIGSFAGWQIVKKYMKKNGSTTLQQLMNLDNEAIFLAAKYKP